MKIYFVILVIHLKQVLKDEFERKFILHIVDSDSIIIDEKDYYVIEKIIRTKTQKIKFKFMIK